MAATLVYAGLTSLGAWLFLDDCRTEPSIHSPGDSIMALFSLHHVGALVWLAVWLGTAPTAWRSGPRPGRLDVVAALTAIALTGLVGALVGDTVPFFPRVAWRWPYLASFALFGVLPGLRGALWGVRMAERIPVGRTGAVGRVAAVGAASAVGAATAWWPMALATMIGVVVNVRRTAPLDAREWATLGAAVAAAVVTAVVVAVAISGARAAAASSPPC